MKLNSDLFWELCKEYDIPLSQDYSDTMFEAEDGSLHVFSNEDIDRIFASESEIPQDKSEYEEPRFEESRFRVDVPAVTTPLLSDEFLLAA